MVAVWRQKGMMANSEPLIDLAVPKNDEIISDSEETNCEITEKSNERNKPQGNGTLCQVMNGKSQEKTILFKEAEEEQSQDSNQEAGICISTTNNTTLLGKYSHDLSQQTLNSGFYRIRSSSGHHSLQNLKIFQEEHENEANPKDNGKHWISTRTGKELQDKFNQTSFIWEIKPLSEILHPSSEIPQRSKNAESNSVGTQEDGTPVRETENKQPLFQDYFQNSHVLEGEKSKSDVQDYFILHPEELKSWQGAQHPEEGQSEDDGYLQSIESQCPESKIPPQLQQTNEMRIKGDAVWISPKIGKEMKCNTTQTSFFWDGKTLAEYLHSLSKVEEVLGPTTDSLSPGAMQVMSVQEYPPQSQEPEDQESHQSIQQPEELLSQHGSQRSVEHNPLRRQTISQLQQTDRASIDEDTMWLQQKTGQDIKCSTTQTSFFWDGKKLVDYLHPLSTEEEMAGTEEEMPGLEINAISSVDTMLSTPASALLSTRQSGTEQPFMAVNPLVTQLSENYDVPAPSLVSQPSENCDVPAPPLVTQQEEDYDPPPPPSFKFRCC